MFPLDESEISIPPNILTFHYRDQSTWEYTKTVAHLDVFKDFQKKKGWKRKSTEAEIIQAKQILLQWISMDIPCSNDGKEHENDEDESTGMHIPSTDNFSEYETPLYDASSTPDSELKSLDDDPSPDFVPGSGSKDSSEDDVSECDQLDNTETGCHGGKK